MEREERGQMRIAHITATFPPYKGGTGNVCAHNARELARRGHDVTVLTAAGSGAAAEEHWEGVQIRRLRPLARLGNAPLLPGLAAALRGYDLVHLHYPFFGAEFAALAADRWGIPLVVTYHQDVLLKGAMGLAAGILTSTVGRQALRAAQRVLYTSLDYGRVSHSRRLLQGREATIDELPNGVDIGHFRPGLDVAALRAKLAVSPEQRTAILVAGLDKAHYFKGVPVFLQALRRLSPELCGVVVGEGDLRETYERQAAALGIADLVHFVGRVDDDELRELYNLADMAVLPSTTMGEAFGLVLVEAMACGKPVVASDLPGVRTVVAQGQDGLLTPPGQAEPLAEALGLLARDPDLRRAMGKRGRLKVEARYSWERVADRLERHYEEVLSACGAWPRPRATEPEAGAP
jgi:glycosyltransferase involved in cell wall biosynthesis